MNKRRIIRQFEYIHIHPANELNSDEKTHHAELKQILQDGLNQLPQKKQTVYRLKKIDGYSNMEVAEQLGITVHTVKSQYNRANIFLKKYVKAHLEN